MVLSRDFEPLLWMSPLDSFMVRFGAMVAAMQLAVRYLKGYVIFRWLKAFGTTHFAYFILFVLIVFSHFQLPPKDVRIFILELPVLTLTNILQYQWYIINDHVLVVASLPKCAAVSCGCPGRSRWCWSWSTYGGAVAGAVRRPGSQLARCWYRWP